MTSSGRLGWVIASVLATLIVAAVIGPLLLLGAVALVDQNFHIFGTVEYQTTPSEKQALRDRAQEMYDAASAGNSESLVGIWKRDGVQPPEEDATTLWNALTKGGSRSTGHRVESFWSITRRGGVREVNATVVFEFGDRQDFSILIGLEETRDGYRLRGFPSWD